MAAKNTKPAVTEIDRIADARKTLNDYIAHTGPHVSPWMSSEARKAVILLTSRALKSLR